MIDYQTMTESIREKQEKLKKELKDLGETYFKQMSRQIFTDFPVVSKFGWTQYTPYFNDGDECVFGIGEPLIYWNDEDYSEAEASDYRYEMEERGYYYISPYNKPAEEYTEKDKAYKVV